MRGAPMDSTQPITGENKQFRAVLFELHAEYRSKILADSLVTS